MNIKPIGAQVGPEAPKTKRLGETTQSTGPEPAQDRVELSEKARQLAGLIGAAQQLPEIREDRVAAAREAIESGTYNVDSRSLLGPFWSSRMVFTADVPQAIGGAAQLLDQLRRRLESADDLALAVQRQLGSADVAAIEAGTARLQSTVEEFKVLFEELERLIPSLEREAEQHPRMVQAKREFEAALSRVARSSAIAGGLLVRIVAITRGRLGVLNTAADGTYLPSGESSPLKPRGVRLKEWV